MNTVQEPIRPTNRTIILKFDSQVLAKLSIGTATVVATILSIPDSIALIPNAPSLESWILRATGVWLSALILWYVSFLALLHLVSFVKGSVKLTSAGLTLWRFGKPIALDNIAGISLEEQKFFSKLFGIRPNLLKLTLFIKQKGLLKLVPVDIPSFFYKSTDFENFTRQLLEETYNLSCAELNLVCAAPNQWKSVSLACKITHAHRRIITVIISAGIALFMARQALLNYSFNMGNKLSKQGQYSSALEKYSLVTTLNPTWSPGWLNLAATEWNLGDFDEAEKHWQKALKLRPDLVEAKVSLAYIYLLRRDFSQAQDYLSRALYIAPQNKEALLNQATLYMTLGKTREAIKVTNVVLSIDPENKLAHCLLAQGRLKNGDAVGALKEIAKSMPEASNENGYCQLVLAEALMQTGQSKKAQNILKKIVSANPKNPDAYILLSNSFLAENNLEAAKETADNIKAQASAANNPWPNLILAEIAIRQKNIDAAKAYLNAAASIAGQDAYSLSRTGSLYLKCKDSSKAIDFANRASKIEPLTKEAIYILQTTK